MSSREQAPAAAELLAAFGQVMRRRRWRWYVFGGQAVLAYGRPRLTATWTLPSISRRANRGTWCAS